MGMFRKVAGLAATGVALLGISGAANATVVFHYDTLSSGALPAGSGPWLTASLTNSGSGVNMTLTGSLGASSEFIRVVIFNLTRNPCTTAPDPNKPNQTVETCPSVSLITGSGLVDAGWDWDFAVNGVPGGPGGLKFDLGSFFNRLQGAESLTFFFDGLDEAAFNTAVDGWYTRAHVQGIGPADCSGWVGDNTGSNERNTTNVAPGVTPEGGSCSYQEVPEPATLGLLGLGLAGIGFGFGSRRRKA